MTGFRPLFLLAWLIAWCQLAPSEARAAEAGTKPNVLLILSDDQRLDTVGCYKLNPNARTPALDRLAAGGVRFNQAYCVAPQCATSRNAIASGRYPHHNGLYTFEKNHAWHDSFRPFWWAQLKHQQGYRTAIVGKEHLLYKWHWSPLPGQRVSSYLRQFGMHPREMIPDDFLPMWRYRQDVAKPIFLYDMADGKSRITETYLIPKSEDEKFGVIRAYRRLRPEIADVILAGYSERESGDLIDDWTLRDFKTLLVNHAADSDYNDPAPLVVELGFKFPHSPITPPREIAQRFEKFNFEIPEFSAREKAEILAVPQMKELYCSLRSDGMTEAEIKKTIAHNFAFCAYGDALVGQAVDAFKALSEQQKRPWLIIFTSDQGVHLHEHGMNEKFTMYSESVRVPFIVASSDKSRFPAGTVHDGFVELIDIAPTILGYCGENLSDPRYSYLDGRDLADILHGRIPERGEVLVQTSHLCGHRALLRTKEWAFSMRTRPPDHEFQFGENYDWASRAPEEAVEMTLFDLSNDPKELRNLAGSAEHKEIRDQLRARLQQRVLGPDRVEYPWHKDTGEAPPFFKPVSPLHLK
jgi:arylsulfatase A-like enzyme